MHQPVTVGAMSRSSDPVARTPAQLLKTAAKPVAHLACGSRRFYAKELSRQVPRVRGGRVLELGSGRAVNGTFPYSAGHLFDGCEEFVRSDVDPSLGHRTVDATTMEFTDEFDAVLCMSVLEHIYDYQRAVDNIRRALKSGGLLLAGLPFCFPLHDEPADYWRFTEHGIVRMLAGFRAVTVKPRPPRLLPSGYFVVAEK